MPKLIRTFCIALFAGTAFSISIDVRVKASLVDDLYNQCVKVYQLGQLNDRGLEYCNKVDQLKQQTEQRSRMMDNIDANPSFTYPNTSFTYPNPGLINQAGDIIRSGNQSLECAYDTSCPPASQYLYTYPTNSGF
jgi:hypothetical protein